MRTFALGDIHGCYTALQGILRTAPLTSNDRLVALGDYIDRGPNSKAVLDWLIERKSQGNLVALRGNHEVMMLAAREGPQYFEDWTCTGGDTALASYGLPPEPDSLDRLPPAHWKFVEATLRGFQTPTHLFVHANAYADLELEDQPDYMLFWEKFHETPDPHMSGRTLVCGHTPQRDGRPLSVGHAICIDTWVYGEGWLTCLDVASGEYWQANERGETRSGWLEPQ